MITCSSPGPLGRSAAGLRLLRGAGEGGIGGLERRRGTGPVPGSPGSSGPTGVRWPGSGEGETARLAGATAAIDVSDGLAADVRHLGRSSDVGVALDSIPAADGASETEAMGGGEDYELLVATPDPDRLAEAFRAAGPRTPLAVGSCTGHPGRYTRMPGSHFRAVAGATGFGRGARPRAPRTAKF